MLAHKYKKLRHDFHFPLYVHITHIETHWIKLTIKLSRMLSNLKGCIQWCKEQSTLVVYKLSKTGCENTLNWQRRAASGDGLVWRCSTKNCHGQASICQNSWLSCSKLSTEKVIPLTCLAHSYTPCARKLVGRWNHLNRNGDWLIQLLLGGLCRQNSRTSSRANRRTWFDCWYRWV